MFALQLSGTQKEAKSDECLEIWIFVKTKSFFFRHKKLATLVVGSKWWHAPRGDDVKDCPLTQGTRFAARLRKCKLEQIQKYQKH